ncbi:MAG: transcriptional regulator BetI [Amaricoccus sp.]|uniref:choline-binding transcriptional repressor BetI n=1 Tax=Amaricoccus sp. TaxID=1872485 RepID=UPI0039E6B99B
MASGTAEMRRKALIGAALREISDRGSLDVTVAQIAERAGVSAALAHHYFGGKDGLIHATMRYLLVEFRAVVADGLRRASTPRERIDAVLRGSFGPEQFHRATVSAWLTFYALAQSSQPAARLLRVYHRRLHSNLVHALRHLVTVAEAERIADNLGAFIDGVYLRGALRGQVSPRAAVSAVEDYLDLELARRA